MHYFAQGSYIDLPQMKVRCPGSAFVATARLRDYRLCFPRWSVMRASALAGIEEAEGETVWGALYDVTPRDLERLDLFEGYVPRGDPALNASQRVTVSVERLDGVAVEAETHVAVPTAESGRPSADYLLVLCRAAKALGFPDDYIAQLKAIETEPAAA